MYQEEYLDLYEPVIYNILTWEEVSNMYDYELALALKITEQKKEAINSMFSM